MPDKEKQSNNSKYFNKKSITIAAIIILFMIILSSTTQFSIIELFRPGTKIGRVREKIQKHLYEDYGEEFVVTNIGTRTANGETDYVARIYPKSIIGTKRENDPYYYSKAGLDKKPLGRLGEVGDGYATVKMNIEAENYLMPKIKDVFGKRVLVKPKIKYKKRNKHGYMTTRVAHNFKEKIKLANNDPENNRLELHIYLYIFDRIDSKQEKEKRRKDIFEFVQYLKEEGLFRYLEMGVYFIDERVLAPSYEEYIDKMRDQKWIEKEISGESIELPPKDFRKKMSQALQSEIDTMSENQLIENMKKIKKCELTYEDLRRKNNQCASIIYSKKRLKEHYGSTEDDRLMRDYKDLNDIVITNNLEYIYITKYEGIK